MVRSEGGMRGRRGGQFGGLRAFLLLLLVSVVVVVLGLGSFLDLGILMFCLWVLNSFEKDIVDY